MKEPRSEFACDQIWTSSVAPAGEHTSSPSSSSACPRLRPLHVALFPDKEWSLLHCEICEGGWLEKLEQVDERWEHPIQK